MKFYKLPQELTARKDLKPSDKIVYAVIADHLGENPHCWPGKLTIMKKTGLSSQTVLDAICRLEKLGYLAVDRRGNGKSNHYKTSPETRPVQKLDQSKNQTTASPETRPEPVQKLDHNQTDLLNQTYNKNKFGDFVLLSNDEFKKLVDKFGIDKTNELIDRLNNGIGSKGYKYKSHYYTILTWERNNSKKENQHQPKKPPQKFSEQKSAHGITVQA